jgi:hypothetical protein
MSDQEKKLYEVTVHLDIVKTTVLRIHAKSEESAEHAAKAIARAYDFKWQSEHASWDIDANEVDE